MAKRKSDKCLCETQGQCGFCGESIRQFPNIDDGGGAVRQEVLVTLAGLQLYIAYKEMAEDNRFNGRIDEALRLEKNCEEIYNRMPRWAKW